jgi:ribosome-associated heat shock protein Hsp15
MNNPDQQAERHRLDKWLWYCRFYKTRALASHAVTGGKVKVNGDRVKPAHVVRTGDRLTVSHLTETMEIEVLSLPARRGPAAEAQACYVEPRESAERRAVHREQRRIADLSRPQSDTRPDKRERRQLEKLRRGQNETG